MEDDSAIAGLQGGLQNLATNGSLLNQNISRLIQTLEQIFPQATAQTSTTASAGAATLPANPLGFMTVTINGTQVKVPYYGA